MSPQAQSIYRFLVNEVLPTKRVTTYGRISEKTGIPLGEGGGVIAGFLGEVFEACDGNRLPPLVSIAVRGGGDGSELYDAPRNRHGMPGPGYFGSDAISPNSAGRRRDAGWETWIPANRPPGFDPDVERWRFRAMIEAHQDSVWKHPLAWPPMIA